MKKDSNSNNSKPVEKRQVVTEKNNRSSVTDGKKSNLEVYSTIRKTRGPGEPNNK